MGLQPWEDVDGNPRMNPKANSYGIDKYYPYGPTCWVNSKQVDMYVTCSESSSITSDILKETLKHLDRKLTFD